jgi:hypothetical protein
MKGNQMSAYFRLKNSISSLLDWSRQLQDENTPENVLDFIKDNAVRLIEESRGEASKFMIPRNFDDELVTKENTTVMHMLKMHQEMQHKTDKIRFRLPRNAFEQYQREVANGVRNPSREVYETNTDAMVDTGSSRGGTSPLHRFSTPC